MRNDRGVLADLAFGAAAGLAATWAMDRVTTYLYEHEDAEARRREDEARGNRTAYESAAERAAAVLGRELDDAERGRLGAAVHWTLGAGAGAVYGLLRRRLPGVAAGHGLGFGTAFFAVVDEGAGTALRLAPPPNRFPWQTHARGLAGHLVFGAVAETLLEAADRLRA